MLHASFATRAFKTHLLIEPSKAIAFVSGLGPDNFGLPVARAAPQNEIHADQRKKGQMVKRARSEAAFCARGAKAFAVYAGTHREASSSAASAKPAGLGLNWPS